MELTVALALAGLLLGSALALLSALARATSTSIGRWDRMEAVRTLWVTVEREVRPGLSTRDWSVTGTGELELRAFRGFAGVCGPGEEHGEYRVSWWGERRPVPDGDSLLVLGRDGGWRTAALTGWLEGEGCGPALGGIEGRMSWAGAGPEPPVAVRLFERGSYSLANRAFRYRRGGAGRQPLTPEVFAAGSGFDALPDGVMARARFGSEPGVGGEASGAVRIRIRKLPSR